MSTATTTQTLGDLLTGRAQIVSATVFQNAGCSYVMAGYKLTCWLRRYRNVAMKDAGYSCGYWHYTATCEDFTQAVVKVEVR